MHKRGWFAAFSLALAAEWRRAAFHGESALTADLRGDTRPLRFERGLLPDWPGARQKRVVRSGPRATPTLTRGLMADFSPVANAGACFDEHRLRVTRRKPDYWVRRKVHNAVHSSSDNTYCGIDFASITVAGSILVASTLQNASRSYRVAGPPRRGIAPSK
ncbi:hypothetical protein [Cupriavidus sp. L7L]|uniref:hypothetical protein n=1 Tax=Cupriavidus sp. L7L TaxID=2546443 RepID=UPI001404C8B9|nr:hypothetical protein [Cupriavidus sp. L7L]